MPILTLLSRRASVAALAAAIILLSSSPTHSFLHQRTTHHTTSITHHPSTTPPPLQMTKNPYGPQDAEIISSSNNNPHNTKAEFTSLLNAVAASDKPEELPSLLATNIEMILSAMNTEGLIEQVIQEDIQKQIGNVERLDELSSAVNVIINFVETFVEEAQSMEGVYKKLMGKIFKVITPNNELEGGGTESAAAVGEAALEELLANETEAFTPGFLRHVDGECNRIATLPTLSPESVKMLEILRVIQARILEELGKGIGEGAVVLGQLLGYDEKAERLAVLDAGLAVRGVDFAHELKGLTSEALEGFKAVQGGVDPGLVKSVEEIDERIQQFIEKSSQHFQ